MREALRQAVTRPPYTEQGGWIYQCGTPNAATGTSRYYLDVAMVEGGYRMQTQMDMRDRIYRAHMPAHPECRTVGVFHVHTSLGTIGAKPSTSDLRGAARRGIPSYFVQPRERPVTEPIGRLDPQTYGDWSEPGVENLSWTCECDAPSTGESDEDAAATCALRGERFFGRVTAEIGTAEPEQLAAGPLEWPRDRSAELTRAIQTDADLVAHVVAQSMGFGANRQSVAQLTELMEGVLRGPMNLIQNRARSLRGQFFGRREHDIVDRGAALVAWDPPGTTATVGTGVNADCRFAIRGSNDLDHDVYIYLYTSYVLNSSNLITGWKQLKIQNYRIAPNKSMDVRYTAGGSCRAFRMWDQSQEGIADLLCVGVEFCRQSRPSNRQYGPRIALGGQSG